MQIEGITGEPLTSDKYPDATPVPRRIKIQGRPIMLECEQALWIALRQVATDQGLSLGEFCRYLLETRDPDNSFADAARIYVFAHTLEQNLHRLPPAERAQVESLVKLAVN
jgi:predicted DNA-binding ribbon-helix-helix protein